MDGKKVVANDQELFGQCVKNVMIFCGLFHLCVTPSTVFVYDVIFLKKNDVMSYRHTGGTYPVVAILTPRCDRGVIPLLFWGKKDSVWKIFKLKTRVRRHKVSRSHLVGTVGKEGTHEL